MKNIIQNITIILLLIIVLTMGIWIVNIYHYYPKNIVVMKDCVPDNESAVNIARVVYKAYCGEDFQNDSFYCLEGEDQWQIVLKASDMKENEELSMNRGITINKKDGTIIRAVISN